MTENYGPLTAYLVQAANAHCQGRIVSVLEGDDVLQLESQRLGSLSASDFHRLRQRESGPAAVRQPDTDADHLIPQEDATTFNHVLQDQTGSDKHQEAAHGVDPHQ